MTTVQVTKDNVTKWLHRIAHGTSLLAGAMALLVISSVAGTWFSKIALSICQPTLKSDGPPRYTLCLHLVGAMGGWAEEIGGTLLVVGAIALDAFSYVIAEHDKVWNMLFMGGPFLVAGVLCLAYWRWSEGRKI
jgi:hypothetical protein